jgi:hypothetical protein
VMETVVIQEDLKSECSIEEILTLQPGGDRSTVRVT